MAEATKARTEAPTKTLSQEIVSSIPGAILVLAVALAAYTIAPHLRKYELFRTYILLKDFILAILLGIVIRNTVGVPKVFHPGLRFSTVLTKTGIVVMGAKYSMMGLVKVGGPALVYIATFLFGSAIALMWVASRFRVPTPLAACLSAGLSVCGVSATIAIAPAVRAKNRDMAYSIAVVLIFGLLALIVFPTIGKLLNLSDVQYGAFCGVGIVNSAQVLAAGFAYSEEAGLVAGIYNIGRVVFLPFVVLMLAIMAASREAREGGQVAEINKMQIIVEKFPVFVLGFLFVVLLNTFGFLNKAEIHQAKVFMNWCFLLGFASIGLTTRLSDLKAAGLSGFLLGFVVAGLKAALALIVVMTFM